MKIKQTLLAGLLMTGLALSAGEPAKIINKKGFEFLTTESPLGFNKKLPTRNILGTQSGFSGSGREWGQSEVSGKGFFINLGVFFPTVNYLNPYYTSGDPGYKVGFDLELCSFFRFAKIEDGQFGIGLRVNWLTLSFSQMKIEKDIYRALQMSPLRLGPQFTLAIDEYMGIDVFYQIGANFTYEFGSIDSPGNSKKVGESIGFLGVSHEVGGIFHYKSYGLGLSYRIGGLKMVAYTYDGQKAKTENLPDDKFSVNNLRIILSFRM